MPTGKYKPERPKPSSALLKQSNEQLKMAIQNIPPEAEPEPPVTIAPPAVTTTSEITLPTDGVTAKQLQNAEIISTYEIVSSTDGTPSTIHTFQNIPIATTAIVTSGAVASTAPMKLISSKGQFVQLKPPSGSGVVQSPSVQNFFVRKSGDKKVSAQPFYTVRTQPITAQNANATAAVPATAGQIAPGKKIIVKSQQILSPATNVKKLTALSTGQMITTIPGTDHITQSSDLANILDLPILFADNEGNIQEGSSNSSSSAIIASSIAQMQIPSTGDASSTPTSSNFILTTSDGKIANRQVVISAASVPKMASKQTYQPANKVIFINRSQIKTSGGIAGSASTTIQAAKQMPPLKLVSASTPTTMATSQPNTFTKLAPGTKIDLSTLKIIKTNATTTGPSIITPKPLVFNVDSKMKKAPVTIGSNLITTKPVLFSTNTKTTTTPSRSTFVIKKGEAGASGAGQHQVLKSGLLNRNITVRKVVNILPVTSTTSVTSSSDTSATAISKSDSLPITRPATIKSNEKKQTK